MAINQHHTSEELEGVKCAIVEKLVNRDRTEFLKKLLEQNGYTVVLAKSPPPKSAPPVDQNSAPVEIIPEPETFTVGVTDLVFNTTNAIFGRLLKTPDGHVVTLAYWQQKEAVSKDDIPYYDLSK